MINGCVIDSHAAAKEWTPCARKENKTVLEPLAKAKEVARKKPKNY